jgi:hypothetical protein
MFMQGGVLRKTNRLTKHLPKEEGKHNYSSFFPLPDLPHPSACSSAGLIQNMHSIERIDHAKSVRTNEALQFVSNCRFMR